MGCNLCSPALGHFHLCDACRKWINRRRAKKGLPTFTQGQCIYCAAPVARKGQAVCTETISPKCKKGLKRWKKQRRSILSC